MFEKSMNTHTKYTKTFQFPVNQSIQFNYNYFHLIFSSVYVYINYVIQLTAISFLHYIDINNLIHMCVDIVWCKTTHEISKVGKKCSFH